MGWVESGQAWGARAADWAYLCTEDRFFPSGSMRRVVPAAWASFRMR